MHWTFKAGAKQHLGQNKHLASAENEVLNVKCSLHLQDQDTIHWHFLCQQKYWNIYHNGVERCSSTHLTLLELHGGLGIYCIANLYTYFYWDGGVVSLLSPSCLFEPHSLSCLVLNLWDKSCHCCVLRLVGALQNKEHRSVLLEALSPGGLRAQYHVQRIFC